MGANSKISFWVTLLLLKLLINATIMSSLKNLYPNFCSTKAKIIWRLGCFVLYRPFPSSKNSQLQNE